MDVRGRRPYVDVVKLLLLLSALLSALTGVGGGGRAQQTAVAVSQRVSPAVAPRAVQPTISGRPTSALPGLAGVAAQVTRPIWRITAAVPLFASRRRE